MLKIGSHVSMSGKDMMLGSVKEALSYGANTFMFYTGAPQNTARKDVSLLKGEEALQLMFDSGIDKNDIVVHAPYIINLGNTIKADTYELAVSFLKQELERCEALQMTRLVLHPGAHVKAGDEVGLNQIVLGLNTVMHKNMTCKIALESMAGKGSELGKSIDELKYIIDHLDYPEHIGICLDTCHLHDSGYDLTKFDDLLDEIDEKIGLDKVLVVHVNDSKNVRGARKDRHENLGHGHIGFETLLNIIYHPKLENVPKILETPYIDGIAPYGKEIDMIKNKQFVDIKTKDSE